jgi:hypothetical protein
MKKQRIVIPEQIHRFVRGFHQDIDREGPGPEEWVSSVLRFMSTEAKPRLRSELQVTLSTLSDLELFHLWHSMDVDVGFGPEGVRNIFQIAVRQCDEALKPPRNF